MRSRYISKYFFIPMFLLVISAGFLSGCTKQSEIAAPNGETKTIKLFVDDTYEYSPKIISVKPGTTLRIEADPATNVGGMDTVVIADYGIRKKITPSDNVIEFVADKTGTFEIVCANGMGKGKLIVG